MNFHKKNSHIEIITVVVKILSSFYDFATLNSKISKKNIHFLSWGHCWYDTIYLKDLM